MKKLFKIIVGIFVIVPVILIAVALIAPRFIDPNDYRDQISELVRSQTGRDLSIDGELAVSMFPWVGIRVQDMSLAQPENVGEGNMLSISEADIRVKVAPLLSRTVEVDTIVLRDPVINMIVMPDGSSSTDGLVSETSGESGPAGSFPITDARSQCRGRGRYGAGRCRSRYSAGAWAPALG